MCIFHNWGRWEDIEICVETSSFGMTQTKTTGQLRQRRRCVRCNKAQDRKP